MRTSERNMRKKTMLDALFPRVRQRVLAALTLNPERRWYERALARHLQLSQSSLQRELDSLVDADVLLKTRDGNRVYVEIKKGFPLLPELQGIFAKTIGLADKLIIAIESCNDSIEFAFVFGSVARGDRTSDSDIDVMIIGSPRMATLSDELDRVEAELKAPVNTTLYSHEEFTSKLNQGNHFLLTVWNEPKIWLKGSEDEFASAFETERNHGIHYQQGRTG